MELKGENESRPDLGSLARVPVWRGVTDTDTENRVSSMTAAEKLCYRLGSSSGERAGD